MPSRCPFLSRRFFRWERLASALILAQPGGAFAQEPGRPQSSPAVSTVPSPPTSVEPIAANRPVTSGTVWMIRADSPSNAGRFASALKAALAGTAGSVREVTANEWLERSSVVSGPGGIALVMPGVVWPADSRAKLEEFLRRGNHLLNLSQQAFSSLQEPLILETLSPSYKTHPTTARRLRLPGKVLDLAKDTPVTIPLPRARGLGCDPVRPARFIPMAEAMDQAGRYRGAAAHLYLNTATSRAGAVWGGLGLCPADLEDTLPDSVALVHRMVERIARGVFLADAGPMQFAYAVPERAATGADVVNLGDERQSVRVSFRVTLGGQSVQEWATDIVVPAHTVVRPLRVTPPALDLAPGEYQVDTHLQASGAVIDEIISPMRVTRYGAVPSRETVSVRGGEFLLDGRPWHPMGVNYWPHLSTGLEPQDFSRSWLLPEDYDPELVERDLATAEQLGVNVLSIQYSDLRQARPLMDFLARAANHRMKVNLYAPAFEPLKPDLAGAQRWILGAHLPESPALFAYDICWEGYLGDRAARSASDTRWQSWVIDRYGSIPAAGEDWHYAPPILAGTLTGPTDAQLMTDGNWRVFVAAYRRFWDDEISRSFRGVREAILAVDSVHLIGARSGYGGNGTPMYAHLMPFDLASGARYLDFVSPEGYALQGDWKGFLRGGLTTAYARFVSGGKPVFWAEYGVPLRWQVKPAEYRPVETAAEFEPQREYFQKMLRFVRETGANGCSGWWWPGGYRLDEQSDFGIINPDGTPRPAAGELQLAAGAYAAPWNEAANDVLLDADRDRYVSGYAGIYTELADQWVQAYLDGHRPGVRSAGTGTTSADMPSLAVGNVPMNGRNPPKYLNAEFTRVELWQQDGWRRIANGDSSVLPAGKARFRVSVANTAEARWLVPGGAVTGGGVLLTVSSGAVHALSLPLSHAVPFLGETTFPEFEIKVESGRPATLVMSLTAEGRSAFGEKFRVQLTKVAREP